MSNTVIWVILAIVVLVCALVWVRSYNRLIRQRNWVEEAFSQIDVQLQKRNDLIPNLVNTVKGYTQHERGTLAEVTAARQQLLALQKQGAGQVEAINEASNHLSSALHRLFAVAEQYPDLKANTNFTQLQQSLSAVEGDLAVARQLYNSSVSQYNISLEAFPSNIIAKAHGFQKATRLVAEEDVRQVPNVSF
ncbi:hypothetical protein CL176_00620 [Suicoccus acidiformans]|uniref:LemA family protein n=1 Tax=Suicoccus acidiformans TaxID=2036206 RepID=A0A347WHU1_9LACT|nr:LemA family protein [Suicoccus acidiformans]AXY24648.1 hypothetical protein CL176_00620 [Suicoccus acidiformans]